MSTPKLQYLLRTRVGGVMYYLETASDDGLRVIFTKARDDARRFTRVQINEFREKHPHVCGRVVLE